MGDIMRFFTLLCICMYKLKMRSPNELKEAGCRTRPSPRDVLCAADGYPFTCVLLSDDDAKFSRMLLSFDEESRGVHPPKP